MTSNVNARCLAPRLHNYRIEAERKKLLNFRFATKAKKYKTCEQQEKKPAATSTVSSPQVFLLILKSRLWQTKFISSLLLYRQCRIEKKAQNMPTQAQWGSNCVSLCLRHARQEERRQKGNYSEYHID